MSASYRRSSIEGRFLSGDDEAVGRVARWVADVLTWPGLWRLRREWGDLHQEILFRVTESLRAGRFDASRDFEAYVRGLARFTALKALGRKRRAWQRIDPRAGTAVDAAVAHDSEHIAVTRRVARQALDWSSARCRKLIRSYYYEQRSYAEIAADTGVAVGTVKSRLFRCLQAVHRMLVDTRPRGSQRVKDRRVRRVPWPRTESEGS